MFPRKESNVIKEKLGQLNQIHHEKLSLRQENKNPNQRLLRETFMPIAELNQPSIQVVSSNPKMN